MLQPLRRTCHIDKQWRSVSILFLTCLLTSAAFGQLAKPAPSPGALRRTEAVVPFSPDRQAALLSARISRTESPGCAPGNSATNLTTAEPEIWGVVEVSNAAVGDVGRFEWINPAGQTVLIVNFQAISAETGPGTYCLNGHLTRPGDPEPLTAGTWNLRIVWTGQIPFTTSIPFVIAAGSGSPNPPPPSGGTGSVTAITLRGGAFSSGAFSSNGQVWDTIPNGFWVLGVTNAAAGAFLNDPSNGTVNLPAGTYVTFSQPTSSNLGSAVEFRVTWSTGQEEVAVFQVGSQTSSVEWTRLLGSTNITVAGAAIGQVDRVRAGDGGVGLAPSPPTDNAIRLTLVAPSGSTTPPPSGGTGANLLQNGNAEAGPASPGCAGLPSIPGWSTGGDVTVCSYSTGGGYPTAADPGPPDRGNNFFGGGFSTTSIMTQVVSIATLAAQVDAGTLPYTLSGYLGGFAGDNDNVSVRADFVNGSGSLIGTALLPAVLAAERSNVTRMNLKTATGNIPVNTRSIRVVVEFTRVAGSSNDGYADSLSLVLGTSGGGTTPPPPPSTGTCNAPSGGTGDYQLTSIQLTRTYVQPTLAPFGVMPASETLGIDRCSFKLGWSFPWGPNNENINRSMGEVFLTQTPLRVAPGATASLAARMTGDWTTSGYGVERDHTVRLSGALGTGNFSNGGPPSGTQSGSFQTTNTVTVPQPTGTQIVLTSNATVRFGDDHVGNMEIRLVYTAPGGTTPPPPANCNYALIPSSANVPGGGSAGLFFRVDTASGCTWSASTSTTWITLDPPTSRTGSGALVYNVAPNPNTAPRTGTIAVSGRTFTVTQAAAPVTPPPSAGPAVSPGGAVNAASGVPSSLPGGAIALASYFSAYGSFGNIQPVQVDSFPLPTTLGGVRIIIRQGSRQVNAIMYFASSTQLNAIMPSDAPIGDVDLIVEVNGQQGPPTRIRTVENNFGIFSVAAGQGPGIIQNFNSDVDQPLNTRSRTARPRQIAIAWGTGSGAIAGVPDNNPPRPLANGSFPQTTADAEVLVGGQRAEILFKGRAPCCAGVDVIYFVIPDNVPTGCSVPVQIRVGANWSNAVTMAIDPTGQVCQDALNPFSGVISGGGKVGTLLLSRVTALAQLEGLGPLNLTVDVGAGVFSQFSATGDLGYSALGALPPLGSCQTMAMGADIQALLGDLGGTLGAVGQGSTLLHAGNELTFVAPSGTRVPMPLIDPNSTSPLYAALLGGGIPLITTTNTPLVLNSGRVTVTGPGGRQVGSFSVSADLLPQPTWSNRDQMTTINRSTGVTFQWSGGDSASQAAILFGASFDQARKAGAGFLCTAPIGAGSFRVPPSVLSNMPTVGPSIGETSGAVLMFAVAPTGTLPSFTANGIDRGMLLNGSINLRTVAVQ